MIRGRAVGCASRALDDELVVGLGHAVEELPVHDEAAVSTEHRAQAGRRGCPPGRSHAGEFAGVQERGADDVGPGRPHAGEFAGVQERGVDNVGPGRPHGGEFAGVYERGADDVRPAGWVAMRGTPGGRRPALARRRTVGGARDLP